MEREHEAEFGKRLEELIGLARRVHEAIDESYSHRKFDVSCVALAWSDCWINDGPAYRHFLGINMKPRKHGKKACAEPQAVGSALANGARLIIGIVVVGKAQRDSKSRLNPPTLHPCGDCRSLLSGINKIHKDTRVVTVHISEVVQEQHTFSQLLTKHRSPKKGRRR